MSSSSAHIGILGIDLLLQVNISLAGPLPQVNTDARDPPQAYPTEGQTAFRPEFRLVAWFGT